MPAYMRHIPACTHRNAHTHKQAKMIVLQNTEILMRLVDDKLYLKFLSYLFEKDFELLISNAN